MVIIPQSFSHMSFTKATKAIPVFKKMHLDNQVQCKVSRADKSLPAPSLWLQK